jgi:hypothetical protein
MTFTDLSDDELVARLHDICLDARRLDARIIEYLAEVEERRLHLKAACSSLFEFCVRRLKMSEGAAFRRINAARLIRRLPRLAGHIEAGRVHLSTLVKLRDHLTEVNVDELVAATEGKSKGEVEMELARRSPKPDVPPKIRKLPTAANGDAPRGAPAPGRIEPLSEARYKMQLTPTAEMRAKLERATNLMRHRNPTGDLAVVIDRALDALLEKLEKERLGKTNRPRRGAPTSYRRGTTGITIAARRETFTRDGEQCTFADREGRRCASRAFLELDHVESRALGGSHEASNLRVFCRAHNGLHAEQVFGRAHVARKIQRRQRKPERPVSHDLVDQVNRPVAANLSDADRKQPVQEGVLRRGRLEARQRAEVRTTRRAVVADALEGHVDERAVVGLESDAEIELHDAVRTHDRPVVAVHQHLSAKPVAVERPSGDGKRDAGAMRSGPDVLRRCRTQTKCHQRTGSHGSSPLGGG